MNDVLPESQCAQILFAQILYIHGQWIKSEKRQSLNFVSLCRQCCLFLSFSLKKDVNTSMYVCTYVSDLTFHFGGKDQMTLGKVAIRRNIWLPQETAKLD